MKSKKHRCQRLNNFSHMNLQVIKVLLQKELRLEFRKPSAFNGIVLYVAATIFISYLCFKTIIDPSAWTALFWIIVLFASVNAAAKSFIQDSKAVLLYYYTLAGAETIIATKIIYNCLLFIILTLLCYLFYSLFIGNLIQNQGLFLLTLCLGCVGISCLLTLVSAIASKTNNGSGLMAVLSFPLLMPLMLTLIKLTNYAIQGIAFSVCGKYLSALGCMDLIVLTLSYLLFPYLWKD